jgi:hypothetical protein
MPAVKLGILTRLPWQDKKIVAIECLFILDGPEVFAD